jgi:hypothetical protein
MHRRSPCYPFRRFRTFADKVALDPSGKSGAFRHHRKDYTARADSAAGFLICGVLIEKAVLFCRNLSAAFSANLTRRAFEELAMTDMTLKYVVKNANPEPLTVIVEPWAEKVVVSPGSSLLLTVLCDREGLLDTVLDPNCLTVWLWGGCRVKLALNGEHLTMPSLLIPSP